MVRLSSRKWTVAQTASLLALIDDGTSAANIALSLRRSVTVIRAKARNLGKPFPGALQRGCSALPRQLRDDQALGISVVNERALIRRPKFS
jgi:hypothetical protein